MSRLGVFVYISACPLFFSFFFYFLMVYFGFGFDFYYDILLSIGLVTFVDNIVSYGFSGDFYALSFVLHVGLFVLQFSFWLKFSTGSEFGYNFKKWWHIEVGTFFLIFFTAFFVFIPAQVDGMTRNIVSFYSNPLAFYAIFLAPVSISSATVAKYVKYRFFKN